jgi:hypothetical protein
MRYDLKEDLMKIRPLLNFLQTLDLDQDVYVALWKVDKTIEEFDVMGFSENRGHAVIDIFEESFEGYPET